MRKHFVFSVHTPFDPTGKGDTKSWLEYYKLNPENGEIYVPFDESEVFDAVPDDLVWFVLDNAIVAYVPVLRCQYDEMNGVSEIWYDASKIVRAKQSVLVGVMGIRTDHGEEWLREIS